MDRDQITKAIEKAKDHITLAFGVLNDLNDKLIFAASRDPDKAAVYQDIRTDACLMDVRDELNGLYCTLAGVQRDDLPAHFARLSPTPKIVTTHVNPPIPIRTSDWCACVEGTEEDGPYGWGRTEEEAIADLQEKLDDY